MSQEALLDRIEFRLAHNAELAKGFAKLRAGNKALLDALKLACQDVWPDNPHWPELYLQRAKSNISVAALAEHSEPQ